VTTEEEEGALLAARTMCEVELAEAIKTISYMW